MTGEFGEAYASCYDALYEDKDYCGEFETIQTLFARYSPKPVVRVLDLGCGSGNHAIPLAQAGFTVVGVDRSKAMLQQARTKAAGISSCTFLLGDIRHDSFGVAFDAALMMFAVLGYQIENESVQAVLRNARRHLAPGGILLFDCWYGPAVLRERPGDRVKQAATDRGLITRTTTSVLNTRAHTCDVRFHVEAPSREPFQEQHAVRYFFPKELELHLTLAGFSMLRLGRFPQFDEEPDDNSWNVWCAAQATLEG